VFLLPSQRCKMYKRVYFGDRIRKEGYSTLVGKKKIV